MTAWIGVTLGDVTGIGPEVALRAIAAEAAGDDTRYLIIGDSRRNLKLVYKPVRRIKGQISGFVVMDRTGANLGRWRL